MPNDATFGSALEFDVLLRRGIGRGVLDLAELFAAFVQHAQHLELPCMDPNRLELAACMQALRQLPPMFLGHSHWRLVDKLAAFDLAPVAHESLCPWQALDDTTLVVACPHGEQSIHSLVSTWCVVLHEQRKFLAYCQREPQIAVWLQAPQAYRDSLAFAFGQDSHTVHQALATEEDGLLLSQLLMSASLSSMHVHTSLQTSQSTARRKRVTQGLLGGLAEMGLLQRPVHLFLGASQVLECLSPYHRDLGAQICAWGDAQWQAHGKTRDVRFQEDPDGSYLLQAAFLRQDKALLQEKHLAERSVGIQHGHLDGASFTWLDLGRLPQTACDPRLNDLGHAGQHDAPILLHLNPSQMPPLAPMLPRLLESLGPLRSVCVIVDGMLPLAPTKTHYQAVSLQSWDLIDSICDLTQKPERNIIDGVHSISVPWLLQAACTAYYLPALSQAQSVLDFGHVGIARILHNMRVRQQFTPDVALHWSVVPVRDAAHRMTAPHIRGHIACALEQLNGLVAPQAESVTSSETTVGPTPAKHKSPSARAEARRIKA